MLNQFILPGLSSLEQLNISFIDYCYSHRNYLNDDYEINGIYGNFPFCIWTGEQANFSNILLLNDEIEKVFLQYASFHINIYLNCTNTELLPDMLEDTYSNLILNNLDRINASNHVVLNSQLLNEYIKSHYKNILIDVGQYNNMLPTKDNFQSIGNYCNLFINPRFNNDFDLIKTFSNRSQLIFILNPSLCINNCMVQNECLLKEHLSQLLFDSRKSYAYSCENWINNINLNSIKNSNLYIAKENIYHYNQLGINHFMLMYYNNINDTISEYINYLIKPEFQNEVMHEFI